MRIAGRVLIIGMIYTVVSLTPGCRQDSHRPTTGVSTTPAATSSITPAPLSPIGSATAEMVEAADEVVVRPIRYSSGDISHDVFPQKILDNPTTLRGEIASQIKAALLDVSTFNPGTIVMCFQPGIRYEFRHGTRSVGVEICFDCQMLRAGPIYESGKIQGKLICFQPGYKRLLRVSKLSLPNDESIQAIPERH